jgi:hypothetical protein
MVLGLTELAFHLARFRAGIAAALEFVVRGRHTCQIKKWGRDGRPELDQNGIGMQGAERCSDSTATPGSHATIAERR